MRGCAVWLLVCVGCGRIGFDPFGEAQPIDAARDTTGSGGEMMMTKACLTSSAYSTPAGLTNRYREGTALVTWADARAACTADGADLWIPTTATEASTLTGDWVGITDVVTEGVWITVEGEVATFLPWDAAQPDGGQAENCVRNTGTVFEDRACTDARDYVCECTVGGG